MSRVSVGVEKECHYAKLLVCSSGIRNEQRVCWAFVGSVMTHSLVALPYCYVPTY
jgi:hypothetical protein